MDKFIVEPCKECGFNVTSKRSLGNHLRHSHKHMKTQDYYRKYYYDNVDPLCKCGCGQTVMWHKTRNVFNDYITGHNDNGYDITTYKRTPEEIQKCNENLKRLYNDPVTGPILREKVSAGVRKVNSTEDYKKNHKEGLLRSWVDADQRKKKLAELTRERWTDPKYYDKIFTEECRLKISLSNSKRNKSRQSAEEDEFFQVIANVFGHDKVVKSSWINSQTYRSAEFDVYVPHLNLYIEYDGCWYHGLSLNKDGILRPIQIHNMKNDVRKNSMVIEAGKQLLRVSSDSNWRNIKTHKDLEKTAYQHIK